jgi:Na+:H+ antiporter, NhaA family
MKTNDNAPSLMRGFFDSEAAGGLVLMFAAAAALIVANSAWGAAYFGTLALYLGPLSLLHWINDGLMAVFFLLVGLELKRELLDGQLSTWPRRVLPGIAAAGGMLVPGLIYVGLNAGDAPTLRGWAIPTATDIAFALGVLSLLGSRVPVSLKVFLTALAIIDDLGAVVIIAVFYTGQMSMLDLGMAGVVLVALIGLNLARVQRLLPYLMLGVALWYFVLQSGVHATVAGVLLAMMIPLRRTPGQPDDVTSPLHRLEHAIHKPVGFFIVPVFGFANAGVSFAGVGMTALAEPVTLGVALGLFLGKLIGVFGLSALTIRLGWTDMPVGARWTQLFGVACLCGIGFTMSLFIGSLAFAADPALQDRVKIGILAGSAISGVLGYLVLRHATSDASGRRAVL